MAWIVNMYRIIRVLVLIFTSLDMVFVKITLPSNGYCQPSPTSSIQIHFLLIVCLVIIITFLFMLKYTVG